MTLWNNVKAEIYKRNGAYVGEITKLTHIEGVNELDVIGSGSIDIPLNYTPAHSLIAENRVCVVTADAPVTGNIVIAQFLIEKVDKIPNKNAGVLRVSGQDLTKELMFDSIGYNVISDSNDGPSPDAIRELLDIYEANSVVNWSTTQWGSGSNKAYLVGSGETIWDAVLQVTMANKGHVNLANRRPDWGFGPVPRWELQFWFNHELDGSSFIHWFNQIIIKKTTPGDSYLYRPLKSIQESKETANTITRCYISGAGLGEDMFTFEDATDTPPAGFTFYPSTGLLINTALEAKTEQPRITRYVQFGNIKPEDPDNATQRRTAANAGLAAGVQFLNENDGSTTIYYDVETTVVGPHTPGQLVTLQYDHTSNINNAGQQQQTPLIDIDDQFILIRYALSMDKDNVLRAKMKLGKTPRPRKSGAKVVVNQVKALETTVKHAKAGASSSSPGGSPPAGGDYLKTTNSPALAGDLPVNAGVRIDSTDISELKLSDFLLANSSAEAIRGRVLQAINGLQFDPGAAGGTATLSLLLAALSGLIVSGNELKLGTPGSLSTTSPNEVTAVSHRHQILSSSNPGQQEWILETDTTGRLQLYRLDAQKLVLTDRATSQTYNVFLENGRLYIESI